MKLTHTLSAAVLALSLVSLPGAASADDCSPMPDLGGGSAAAPAATPAPSSSEYHAVPASSDMVRPPAPTIGLGFGVNVGSNADLTMPQVAGARIVTSERWTFEPQVQISNAKVSSDPAGPVGSSSISSSTLSLSAIARMKLAARSRVDLDLLMGGGFGYTTTDQGADRDTLQLSLQWGLGLTYYLSQWWAVGLDVRNDLLSLTQTKQMAALGDDTDTTRQLGIVFNPLRALLMLYLFF